jgi:uncharacterized protein YuzE
VFEVSYDPEVRMAYVKLTDQKIVQTFGSDHECGFEGMNIDMDAESKVVGIEFFL